MHHTSRHVGHVLTVLRYRWVVRPHHRQTSCRCPIPIHSRSCSGLCVRARNYACHCLHFRIHLNRLEYTQHYVDYVSHSFAHSIRTVLDSAVLHSARLACTIKYQQPRCTVFGPATHPFVYGHCLVGANTVISLRSHRSMPTIYTSGNSSGNR